MLLKTSAKAKLASVTQQRQRRTLTFAALATLLAVIIIDQLSKFAIVSALSPRQVVPVLGDWFRLYLVRNPGAAFSLGTDATPILASIQLAAVVLCIFLAFRSKSLFTSLTIGLIGGGAAGNLCDRIFREPGGLRGHVVDFLSFWNFAIFNLADAAITVGVVLYLINEFFIAPRRDESIPVEGGQQ